MNGSELGGTLLLYGKAALWIVGMMVLIYLAMVLARWISNHKK